jgi:hypothetical protein
MIQKWNVVVFASVCCLAGGTSCDAFVVPNPSCPHHRQQQGVNLSARSSTTTTSEKKKLTPPFEDIAPDQGELLSVEPTQYSLASSTAPSSYGSSRRQWFWSGLAVGIMSSSSSQVASAKVCDKICHFFHFNFVNRFGKLLFIVHPLKVNSQ